MMGAGMKKKMGVFLFTLLFLTGCSSGSGPSSAPAAETSGSRETTAGLESIALTAPTGGEPEPVSYSLASIRDKVKVKGRSSVIGEGVSLDWTASGLDIRGRFTGDVLLTANLDSGKDAYFEVVVDGNREQAAVFRMDPGVKTYPLASDLPEGKHTIELTKRTAATSNLVIAQSLTFTGELQTVPAAERRIEFIGDSLTCGLGSEDSGGTIQDRCKTEDGANTYAALTARAVGADYQVVSVSGWGVAAGADDKNWRISRIYEKASYRRDSEKPWDFSGWRPDLVVINLGSNDDNFRRRGGSLTDEEFIAGVRELIAQVQRNNPGAEIVWAYGLQASTMHPLLVKSFEQLGAEGITVHYVRLPQNTDGGSNHASTYGHQYAAEKLTEQVRAIMGWD